MMEFTGLFITCAEGHIGVVQLLLGKGIDI
jgi:hypothetical protein